MTKYVTKRILIAIVTLILVSIITFVLFSILPGDVGRNVLGLNASQKEVDAYNERIGLNKPVLIRYFDWMLNLFKGNLGESYQYNATVVQLIGQKFPATLFLALMSFLLIVLVSIPLAIFSAKHEKSFIDNFFMVKGQVLMSIPNFFLAILLSWIFGILLKLFIPGAYVDYNRNFGKFLVYLIFPAIAVSLPRIGMAAKFLRTSIIEQKRKDYVRTAKGIGLSEREIMFGHVLKNAFLPFITFMGIILSEIVAGSVIIEQIFQIPGIGRLLLDAINYKDILLVQGLVMFIAFMVITISFIVDIVYSVLDPRVKV